MNFRRHFFLYVIIGLWNMLIAFLGKTIGDIWKIKLRKLITLTS